MYEYNRSTGIASTRYRPLQTPRLPGFSFHNHRSSHAIQRPCRSSHQLLFQGESNPKTPIPILRVLTLAYARVSLARAFRPAQKDTPLHSIRRTHAEPIRTTHRAALQHCSTAVPGCSSRLQATKARDRPGEYVRHLVLLTRRSRCWSCCQLPGLPMARAGRLVTRSRPCGYDSTLCNQGIRCALPACSSMGTCSLHMGSCESVVGAIAEAETAA